MNLVIHSSFIDETERQREGRNYIKNEQKRVRIVYGKSFINVLLLKKLLKSKEKNL